jgi:hypothetical protein
MVRLKPIKRKAYFISFCMDYILCQAMVKGMDKISKLYFKVLALIIIGFI